MGKATQKTKEISDKIRNIDKILERIAYDGASLARQLYEDAGAVGVDVSVEKTADGYKIVSHGEQVLFVEFGTGILTEPNGGMNPLADQVIVPIQPGSFSMSDEGAQTWAMWYDTHDGDMSQYPYNFAPRHVMWDVRNEVNIMLDEQVRGMLK